MSTTIATVEEHANALTHGIGLVLVLVAVPILIVLAATSGDVWQVVGVAIYGTTLILLYTASTMYHAVRHPPAKRVLRILDHSAIYLLIAGTYTPFTFVNLRGAWGWTLFGLVWALALCGIIWKVVRVDCHEVVSTILYIAMGWLVVIAVRPLSRAIPISGLAWLLAGGVAYTLGVGFFGASRLRFNHAVWHVFVLMGSACHYVAVMHYVLTTQQYVNSSHRPRYFVIFATPICIISQPSWVLRRLHLSLQCFGPRRPDRGNTRAERFVLERNSQ